MAAHDLAAPAGLRAAIGQRPRLYLRSAWPWRALAWSLQAGVASGIVIGMATAVIAPPLQGTWPLTTIGGWLLEVLMLALFVPSCAAVAAWQRRAVTIIGARPVVSAYPLSAGPAAPRPERIGPPLRGVLRDGALARDVAFSVLFAPLGAVAGGLTLLVPPAAGGGLVALALGLAGHESARNQDFTTWVTAGGAAALLVALPWLSGLAALAGRGLAQGIMDPHADRARAHAALIASSQRRLAGAFDAERRRIERDLHDGVQQLIVAQSMTLGLAAAELADAGGAASGAAGPAPQAGGSPGAGDLARSRELVDKAREENRRILAELRDLVRRVHPKVLTDRGLAAALEEVVARSPLDIEARMAITGRPPELLESTAYFVALEGLTNAAKHAPGARVQLRAATRRFMLAIAVVDDGPGGAQVREGGGLAGLAERVAAVGGTLQVSSPPGRGTVLRAELPYEAIARTDLLPPPDPARAPDLVPAPDSLPAPVSLPAPGRTTS